MSIKLVHILFIIFVALCAMGYAAWVLLGGFGSEATSILRMTGWLGGGLGIVLLVYVVIFARKSRKIIV